MDNSISNPSISPLNFPKNISFLKYRFTLIFTPTHPMFLLYHPETKLRTQNVIFVDASVCIIPSSLCLQRTQLLCEARRSRFRYT